MHLIKKELSPNVFKVRMGDQLVKDEVIGDVELDIETQANFVEFMANLFEDGEIDVILDMHNVVYLDSSGLWALFEGHKKAVQNKGALVLLSPSKDVKRVLDITKMSSKLLVFSTEKEALDGLAKLGEERNL